MLSIIQNEKPSAIEEARQPEAAAARAGKPARTD